MKCVKGRVPVCIKQALQTEYSSGPTSSERPIHAPFARAGDRITVNSCVFVTAHAFRALARAPPGSGIWLGHPTL